MSMSMGGGGGERHRAMSEINVTPMVDIMLVLLIIFMVAAPMLNQGVEIDLPKANANPLPTEQETMVIGVKADGRLFIEETALTIDEITAKVTAIRQANPKLLVYVRGDRQAYYGEVAKVMTHLQQAGVTQVGLVTEPR